MLSVTFDYEAMNSQTNEWIVLEQKELICLKELPGEVVDSTTDTSSGCVHITNYRIVIVDYGKNAIANIPLLSVEAVDILSGNPYGIQITCKTGRIFKLCCPNEIQVELHKKLRKATCGIKIIDIFAWRFADASKGNIPNWIKCEADSTDIECSASEEFNRLNFNPEHWRISEANVDHSICKTYPRTVIIPKDITDDELRSASLARNNCRFPAAVWRCDANDAVLLRSSQPCPGIFNYRYPLDEKLLESVRKAVGGGKGHLPRLLIVDCRSYTAVLANRVVKGGGVESEEYYQETDIEFMGLPNIHSVRDSFSRLRSLFSGPRDQATILQSLQNTLWLQYLKGLIDTAQRCVCALVDDGCPVLVHCTDGWDRTTQVETLAKIIADPYYRTFEGFKNLIRRDWIDFGHKFGDRSGSRSTVAAGEASPCFLQWLDCVFQLHHIYPDAFQFSVNFLSKLALHSQSGLFGTFLWNSQYEREKWCSENAEHEALSIWSFLNECRPEFVNVIYQGNKYKRLYTAISVEDLPVWKQVYVGPAIERLISTADQTFSSVRNDISQPNDADRISLTRAHSAESLSNTDPTSSQISNTAYNAHSQFHGNVAGKWSSATSEVETQQPLDETDSVYSVQSRYRKNRAKMIVKEVDFDGLTKDNDNCEDIMRKKVEAMESKTHFLVRRIEELESEQVRYTVDYTGDSGQTGNQVLCTANSGSCSDESLLSDLSMIDKDDASEVSDGSKGWLLDRASQRCMRCNQKFFLSNRKHHCRNCGRIFCANCTNHSYHRVHDNRGENVRVCSECYSSMSSSPVHNLRKPASSSALSVPRNNRSTSSAFSIDATDGQMVYG